MEGCRCAALTQFDHEHVQIVRDSSCGLLAIVAVHSTALGPAMGGVRRARYASLDDALADALRLSAAMTVKSSLAGLPLGGGKSVIVHDGAGVQPAALEAFATALERLGGMYVAAEDIGTSPADMDAIAAVTRWVAGRSPENGGSGDPSPATARTVLAAIEHARRLADGVDGLDGVRVGVIGVGKVGGSLVQMLTERGAEVLLADIDGERALEVATETGARAVPLDGLPYEALDVLAPCARGGLIDERTASALQARIVCGAANNVLAEEGVAQTLADLGVLYVPDFVANAGGIIQVGGEFLGWEAQRIEETIVRSTEIGGEILAESASSGETPLAVATDRALSRVLA